MGLRRNMTALVGILSHTHPESIIQLRVACSSGFSFRFIIRYAACWECDLSWFARYMIPIFPRDHLVLKFTTFHSARLQFFTILQSLDFKLLSAPTVIHFMSK